MRPPQSILRDNEEENLENEWLNYLMNKKAKSQKAVHVLPEQWEHRVSNRQRKAITNGK